MSRRIIIVMPVELVERIDTARGIASRAAWIRRALEIVLAEEEQ